jgi:hypothetical protein
VLPSSRHAPAHTACCPLAVLPLPVRRQPLPALRRSAPAAPQASTHTYSSALGSCLRRGPCPAGPSCEPRDPLWREYERYAIFGPDANLGTRIGRPASERAARRPAPASERAARMPRYPSASPHPMPCWSSHSNSIPPPYASLTPRIPPLHVLIASVQPCRAMPCRAVHDPSLLGLLSSCLGRHPRGPLSHSEESLSYKLQA